jgi:hypothetical protein
MVLTVRVYKGTAVGNAKHLGPASSSRGGLSGLTGVTTRPAGHPSGGVPPAVARPLHLHHTPSRTPQRWGTTSCREAAPLTPHAQPGTPAVGYHQLSRGSSTFTTRPAGHPSGGVPPAVERQLHLHHTPSRVPPRWGAHQLSREAPLTYFLITHFVCWFQRWAPRPAAPATPRTPPPTPRMPRTTIRPVRAACPLPRRRPRSAGATPPSRCPCSPPRWTWARARPNTQPAGERERGRERNPTIPVPMLASR